MMIPQFPPASSLARVHSLGSVPVLKDEPRPRITASGLGCRLIQMVMALYLIPAVLVVLLVGAVGILAVGLVRLFIRLLDATDRG